METGLIVKLCQFPDDATKSTNTISDLVRVVLEGTNFEVLRAKRSPVTKKLIIHIADRHSQDISQINPNQVRIL